MQLIITEMRLIIYTESSVITEQQRCLDHYNKQVKQ